MNDATVWATLLPYAPVTAYLCTVSLLLWTLGRVPHWLHVAALVVALPVRVLQSGWTEPAVTAGAALLFFVVLVGIAARTVSGVSLFSVVITLALCPLTGWLGIGVGLLIAALVAAARTWRNLGKERVVWLTADTLSAMGLAPSGHLKPLQPELVPERDSLTDVNAHTEEAARLRMFLPPWLLLGVGVAVALAFFG